MKKSVIYISVSIPLTIVILLLAGWYYYIHLYNEYRSELAVEHHEAGDSISTNAMANFSEEEIAMYGKWEDAKDKKNFTVFTLDDAGDGFYWGKEWSEADNVFEEDLDEHGNGWFRWKTKKNNLLILYNSSLGFSMPLEYSITQLEEEELGVQRKISKSKSHFSRAYN